MSLPFNDLRQNEDFFHLFILYNIGGGCNFFEKIKKKPIDKNRSLVYSS